MWCLDCHLGKDRDTLRSVSGERIDFDQSYLLCGQCHSAPPARLVLRRPRQACRRLDRRARAVFLHPSATTRTPRWCRRAHRARHRWCAAGLSPMQRVPAHAPPRVATVQRAQAMSDHEARHRRTGRRRLRPLPAQLPGRHRQGRHGRRRGGQRRRRGAGRLGRQHAGRRAGQLLPGQLPAHGQGRDPRRAGAHRAQGAAPFRRGHRMQGHAAAAQHRVRLCAEHQQVQGLPRLRARLRQGKQHRPRLAAAVHPRAADGQGLDGPGAQRALLRPERSAGARQVLPAGAVHAVRQPAVREGLPGQRHLEGAATASSSSTTTGASAAATA